MKDDFLNGTNATYVEQLEEQFRQDPGSVDPSWRTFLRLLDGGHTAEGVAAAYGQFAEGGKVGLPPVAAAAADAASTQTIQESMRLLLLVRAFQVNGHQMANLDPLGLDDRPPPMELDPALYGFTEADLDREFFLGTWRMKGFLSEDRPRETLRQIIDRLKETYCGTIGFEYMHIPERDKCNWLRERIETQKQLEYSVKRKRNLLDRLAWSDMFEAFLSSKYTAAKRFGLEGGETLIPGMKELIDKSAELGVESITIGMPHRGRLNVLANVVRKPLQAIFNDFNGGPKLPQDGGYSGSGDVKYHLGTSYDRPTLRGGRVHLSLVANPSHLEAVNTVVQGKTRAKQYYSADTERSRNMAVLLHGDGAFSGQGIVYETLDMSQLPDYSVGGTIHIVVNNQVAFTTDPKYSRSSPYCTDVAKVLNVPIFHVNGDDMEAVARACELAAEWRHTWKSDAVIDIVCYRKHGHNEIDEPMFTQPLMYKTIKKHRSAHQQYADKLVKEGSLTAEEVKAVHDKVTRILNEEFDNAKNYVPKARDWLSSHWAGFKSPDQLSRIRNTGVKIDILKQVGMKLGQLPEGFTPHRQISKVYAARKQMIESGEGIDWATAEALAFGTLLMEGNHVRLSGQDVERGTFSHRHAIVHDQNTGERYCALDNLYPGQKDNYFSVSNSSLSEFGVLGFELGYSLESPNALVLWEAQFGDFANGAQVIIDQFISSGEAKWLRQTGIVMLLPHGYDGQGPEHSSARLERYLQQSDDDPRVFPKMDHANRMQVQECNWQVANVTTPANYFHLLRRQIHRDFRKPLIVMSPKNLLRHPKCKSPLSHFDDEETAGEEQGTRFKRLIMDQGETDRAMHPPVDEKAERVVFCSGKVYYELAAEREAAGKEDTVKICRVEQISPFPFDLVARELRRYPNAKVIWCQEEPMNMGAYTYVAPRFETSIKHVSKRQREVEYVGRAPASSTATGFHDVHVREQQELVTAAIHE